MANYRRRKKNKPQNQFRYYINNYIRDPFLQVIDDEGNNLGTLSRYDALKKAQSLELDLVKVNPKADPPIAKILDWSKMKYQQSKAQAAKAKEKKTKTIRVSVKIAPHDLKFNAERADKFLEKGHQVKLQVKMVGREKKYPEVAAEVLPNLMKLIEVDYQVINDVKKTGDSFFATIQASNKNSSKANSETEE